MENFGNLKPHVKPSDAQSDASPPCTASVPSYGTTKPFQRLAKVQNPRNPDFSIPPAVYGFAVVRPEAPTRYSKLSLEGELSLWIVCLVRPCELRLHYPL